MLSNPTNTYTSMDVQKPKLEEEGRPSGAYIRSLVRQLSSTRPKDCKNSKSLLFKNGGPYDQARRMAHPAEVPEQSTQTQLPKKQVRRRLHTRRPYQERLLNMAEARREIVTALKVHRAAMRRAKEEEEQRRKRLTLQASLVPSLPSLEELPHELMNSQRNCRVYPPNCTFLRYNNSFSPLSFYSPISCAYPSTTPFSVPDDLDVLLPSQPLGLNLNLQGFNNIDASFCIKPQNKLSSSSYSNSSTTTTSNIHVVPSLSANSHPAPHIKFDPANISLHQAVDDEEIAQIHSIGEQHDMEWNDTVNLATSAWWNKLLKNMEDSTDERENEVNHDEFHVFDEMLDIPSWLNDGVGGDANESFLLQQHLDESYYSEDYQHDAALPCLDIEEIEGWEWLS